MYNEIDNFIRNQPRCYIKINIEHKQIFQNCFNVGYVFQKHPVYFCDLFEFTFFGMHQVTNFTTLHKFTFLSYHYKTEK